MCERRATIPVCWTQTTTSRIRVERVGGFLRKRETDIAVRLKNKKSSVLQQAQTQHVLALSRVEDSSIGDHD